MLSCSPASASKISIGFPFRNVLDFCNRRSKATAILLPSPDQAIALALWLNGADHISLEVANFHTVSRSPLTASRSPEGLNATEVKGTVDGRTARLFPSFNPITRTSKIPFSANIPTTNLSSCSEKAQSRTSSACPRQVRTGPFVLVQCNSTRPFWYVAAIHFPFPVT